MAFAQKISQLNFANSWVFDMYQITEKLISKEQVSPLISASLLPDVGFVEYFHKGSPPFLL